MKRSFCDRCGDAVEITPPFISVDETIPTKQAGGLVRIRAWVAFGGNSENGSPREIDLCWPCVSLFCAALANRAKANEKPPNPSVGTTREPDYSL